MRLWAVCLLLFLGTLSAEEYRPFSLITKEGATLRRFLVLADESRLQLREYVDEGTIDRYIERDQIHSIDIREAVDLDDLSLRTEEAFVSDLFFLEPLLPYMNLRQKWQLLAYMKAHIAIAGAAEEMLRISATMLASAQGEFRHELRDLSLFLTFRYQINDLELELCEWMKDSDRQRSSLGWVIQGFYSISKGDISRALDICRDAFYLNDPRSDYFSEIFVLIERIRAREDLSEETRAELEQMVSNRELYEQIMNKGRTLYELDISK